jgi:hypothetical protein
MTYDVSISISHLLAFFAGRPRVSGLKVIFVAIHLKEDMSVLRNPGDVEDTGIVDEAADVQVR